MKKLSFLLLAVMAILSACENNSNKAPMTDNPFLMEWDTPFGVPPFDKIKNEHFMPAFEKGIELQNQEIEALVNNTEKPTFANTIEALDKSGRYLRRVQAVFFNLTEAHTSDAIMAINDSISPRLANHKDNIMLNEKLFARVKTVADEQKELNLALETENASKLSTEQQSLLDEIYNGFVRGGVELKEADKARLREINEKLASLYPKFGNILMQENNEFYMHITDEAELAGLSEGIKSAAAETAREKGVNGWAFTLDKPSWIPFLQYSENRARRQELYTARMNRGNNEKFNTSPVINEILVLREEKARLMGYANFAEFTVSDNMAKTTENVYKLMLDLWKPALAKAKAEGAELQSLMNKDGIEGEIKSWDWWYYTEKLRAEKFNLDENQLRPYFSLEKVKNGAFELASRLYAIKFVKRDDLPKYHPDVEAYEVTEEDGKHIGVLYLDYFPRASKRGGAWMEEYRKQSGSGADLVSPIIVNVCNFTKPTGNTPSLLSIEEVETLFHEFGHGLHGLLSQVQYQTISGTSVKRDFVELPSQIMENWCMQPEMLKLYAFHYETGEVIPQELVEKIQQAAQFNQGFVTVEYLASALLDMDYHTASNASEIDLSNFETNAMNRLGLIDAIIPRYKTNYFSHSFDGEAYAAGYYVYIWAAVLDTDAFELFVQKGLFDRETGKLFRDQIISKGGSNDPMIMYTNFRGAQPDITPLLKKRGLL